MTVYTVVAPTPVAFSGLAPTASSVFEVEAPEPVQFYGLPTAARTASDVPAVAPPVTPDAVSARVLDAAGTFIANLPSAQGLRFLDEFNTAGAGSIDYRRYDAVETEHPGLWSAGNQVLISVGGVQVFRLVLDAEGGYRIDQTTGDRVDSWPGKGALGILDSGMVEPEYGWRDEATEERSFDYGSNPNIGGWLVASEWRTPVGKLLRDSWRWTHRKRHLPRGFPTRKAYWLWYRNPDSTSTADETCYFRSSFTISSARRVKFWVCGDDTLEFQVDGEVRLTAGRGGWKKASRLVLHLSAGTHYVAAKVTNKPGTTGNANRSGFLCAIGRINGDGDVVEWLRLTKPGTWTVRRQLGSAPGWYAAQILRQLVLEQQSRGCAGHAPVTFSFNTVTDSVGVPWVGRQEMSIPVGTPALDYVQQLVETGIDVAMTPGLTLQAWCSRGVDRSGWIRITGKLDESAPQSPTIRNTAHARAKSGWVGRADSASVAAHGRREVMMALGSSRSLEQTDASIAALLPDLADPPLTREVSISGAAGGPHPYRDFDNGDWIGYRPAGSPGFVRCRVMSIGLTDVAPEGHPIWAVKLYED